jgi:hypothetical protein
MTLQSSGVISLSNVQTEFGGANPIGINEYYGAAAGVPASGLISLSDFYGKSAATNQITTAAIFGNSQQIGYNQAAGFGSISPVTWAGRTIILMFDRNDGSSPVHSLTFRVNTAGVAQGALSLLRFTDKNGVVRTFTGSGVGSNAPILGFTNTAFTEWTWNCDSLGTGLFWNSGVVYPLVIT